MSQLDIPGHGPCAFCEYLSGARPYTVLTRSAEVAVLVTREQRGIGHVLVLPVLHTPTLLELPESLAGPLMTAVRDAARLVSAAYEPDGIAIWQNNGVAAGQAIAHLHFHVAGTLPEGGTNFGDVEEVGLEVTELIAERLRRSTASSLAPELR